jgi:hypothetical protein
MAGPAVSVEIARSITNTAGRLAMILSFEDVVTWMYVIVDDVWQQLAPVYHRPGPAPRCSDSELLTMLLVGEWQGWHTETALVRHWAAYPQLFPVIPERSRLNRRRRGLLYALNDVRRLILRLLDLAQDRHCVIDSLPVPVIQFHLVPSSPAAAVTWKSYDATYGYVPTKKQRIFGYKLTLLIALNGVILDFELAPANAPDLAVGEELLARHAWLIAIGDTGYVSAPVAAALDAERDVHLLTVPRRNQHQQLPREAARRLNRLRQMIETVNSQLTEQFQIGRHQAHTFWGLCARLYAKLTAHTLCIYLNRLLGKEHFLQITEIGANN